MILGLMGNRQKERVASLLPDYVRRLADDGIEYLISSDFEGLAGLEETPIHPDEELARRASVVLSFGGDGTLLNTVKRLGGASTPVLGVNLGGLGYLTEASGDELWEATCALKQGQYEIGYRLVLEVRAEDGDVSGPWFGLNDVVVDKAGYARLILIDTQIDELHLNTFRADGLIVSTPTGSTGYNLSAGGPILEPTMGGLLITPLNPHSLSNRPLVVDDNRTVRVSAQSPMGHVNVAVDGETVCRLGNGQFLTIRRAGFSAPLVKLQGRRFYDVLRQKLGWGESGSADAMQHRQPGEGR